jgi:hypothetical protein
VRAGRGEPAGMTPKPYDFDDLIAEAMEDEADRVVNKILRR